MRFQPLTAAVTLAMLSGAALAAPPKEAPRTAPAAGQPSPNTVVATVNGDPIRMSDVAAAAQQIPQQMQGRVPPEQLFPLLIDQLVSGKAVAAQARKEGLDRDPRIARQMQAAADQVLQSAALQKAVLPQVNEDAIKTQYDKEYAGKPGETEVHARHILVDSQAKAQDIIKQLDGGAKFEDLAKKYGDPKDASSQQGGDLGFFKKGDMLPEFSDAAFALKPGQITQTPVHTRFGWHVIKLEQTRVAPPPPIDEVRDEIRQQIIQEGVAKVLASAKQGVKVEKFNPDGTPYTPPPVPGAPGTQAPAK